MKERCLFLINDHFPSFVHQPEFRDLPKSLLLDVLEVLVKSKH